MHPGRSTAVLRLTSDDGATSAEAEVGLLPGGGVVCIDFIPRLFGGSVLAMYAIAADRVAVLMEPFATGVDWRDRAVVRFDVVGRRFERVSAGRRIRISGAGDGGASGVDVTGNDKSGVEVFGQALERLFGRGRNVVWGGQQIMDGHGPFP